jgi:leader peptidase (prepilin peptidase) / N-methyltransferase
VLTPDAIALIFIAIFGLCVGSFLNVVIARIPEGRSIVFPGSACPRCGKPIAWYDNLPVLSYALLRSRCRTCQGAISWRYPAVELACGLLFVLAYRRFEDGTALAAALILLAGLLAITAIDLDHQIIPDVLSLPGIAVGVLFSVAPGGIGWAPSLLGVLLGGGVFVVIIVASTLVLGQAGMGVGDVKLGAMLGAFLGWKLALLSILLSTLLGGPIAAVLLATGRKSRKDPIPFGPFLTLGGFISLFWGDALLAWYFAQFQN